MNLEAAMFLACFVARLHWGWKWRNSDSHFQGKLITTQPWAPGKSSHLVLLNVIGNVSLSVPQALHLTTRLRVEHLSRTHYIFVSSPLVVQHVSHPMTVITCSGVFGVDTEEKCGLDRDWNADSAHDCPLLVGRETFWLCWRSPDDRQTHTHWKF